MQTEKAKQGLIFFFFLTMMTVSLPAQTSTASRQVVWKLTDTSFAGGVKPLVLGVPQTVHDKGGSALAFDGKGDGLIFPVNPLQDLRQFAVEILFQPAADGPLAPRLLHGEDKDGSRFTVEARITKEGFWYLDTFLKAGKTGKGLTLVDSAKLHPCGGWYWAALLYDGTTMTHCVNAAKEGEGTVNFGPMATGQTAVAVRLNHINWFKGSIGEVRFHSGVTKPEEMQGFKKQYYPFQLSRTDSLR